MHIYSLYYFILVMKHSLLRFNQKGYIDIFYLIKIVKNLIFFFIYLITIDR